MFTVEVMLKCQTSKRVEVGMSPTVGKNFSFCNSHFFACLTAMANEIKREMNLADTLFSKEFVYLLFHLSF